MLHYFEWPGGPDTDDCDNCQGTGKVTDKQGKKVDCPVCEGTGVK